MGWFWADAGPKLIAPVAPHPIPPSPNATPPPACPMHKSDSKSSPSPFSPRTDSSKPSSCPVKSPNHPLRSTRPPPSKSTSTPQNATAQQPFSPPPTSPSTLSKLNPLNFMPTLTNQRETDSPQTISLPLSREPSSIPRSDSANNWEYPSPQQMYNAMLRKGYTDTPAEHVESMVAVHNFLNEGAWAEIEEWENLFAKGLGPAWTMCQQGEEGIQNQRARREFLAARREALGLPPTAPTEEQHKPKLIRFQGRPQEPTPKARILTLLGTWFPDHFNCDPPFDRHDWYVSRVLPDGSTREIRYVIDYYGGGVEDETGQPVFYLDIRPALDGPTAVAERAMRWGGDLWYRASGGAARQAFARERQREMEGKKA